MPDPICKREVSGLLKDITTVSAVSFVQHNPSRCVLGHPSSRSLNMDDYDGKKSPATTIPVAVPALSTFNQQSPRRPPIIYSSPAAFFESVKARWRSVWTKRFILSLVFGQIVSLCITCTNVTTTELVNRGLSLPTMQNNLL